MEALVAPPADPPLTYTLLAPAVATAPRVCRDFVRSALNASGLAGLADAAALCTSELATNVHLHAKGDIRLGLAIEPTRIRIDVHDGSDGLPTPRRPSGHDTHGRGLFLVTALSDVCGVAPDSDGNGKGVWFELNVVSPEG
jgi:anti-sigma regulatory factor (Ser/Thr protein kinase)